MERLAEGMVRRSAARLIQSLNENGTVLQKKMEETDAEAMSASLAIDVRVPFLVN